MQVISRGHLLPFGTDWVPVIPSRFDGRGDPHQVSLLKGLCSESSGLLVLLCALLAADNGNMHLPSSDKCKEIMEIYHLYFL